MPYKDLTDDYDGDDDYILSWVVISPNQTLRVRTYGPYTEQHARRVKAALRAEMRDRPGWTQKLMITRMTRENLIKEVA